ncbi:MAG: hypothetical protein JWN13_2978 [Betaproteobacteria bacterium]|jgi:hypothetical protein|nr:hypothetical protein [Betaproteobacteria bacterium]
MMQLKLNSFVSFVSFVVNGFALFGQRAFAGIHFGGAFKRERPR